jgi:hypothetical protein
MKKYKLPFSFPSMRKPGFKLPFLSVMSLLPTPYTKIQFGGMKVAVAALGVVAVGFIATLWLTIAGTTHEILWPTPGASYDLPYTIGERLPPDADTPMTASQTLRINLKDGARLDRLVLKDLQLGKAGLATAFEINRTTGVTGAMVTVGAVTIINSSAPTLDWANINAGTITIGQVPVDGHTNNMCLDPTLASVVVDSDRGSGTFISEGAVADRVIINLNGDNGATIGELVVDNVDASVGAWDWQYLTVGTLTMDATNTFGNNTGIDVPSVIFNDSVCGRVVTSNMVDTPVSVK